MPYAMQISKDISDLSENETEKSLHEVK